MSGWTYACLVVGLILLAAPASALIPDKIEILDPSPDDWVTAGSGETVTITARVLNNTPDSNAPVGGVAVEFTLDGGLGRISSTQAITNKTGYAATVFTPGTTSGDVTITATVALNASVKDSVGLYIDHAAPYKIADLWYEPEVTAGETTEIVVRMVDRYGNVIDSRNAAESVRFMVGSPEGGEDAIFDDPEVDVDSAGDATATLRAGTVAGENLVWIQPPKTVKGEYISITGVAGPVVKITQVVDPSSASVPADGDKVVSFTYTLFDEYANPAAGQELLVSALVKRVGRPEELQTVSLHSNSHGQVMITYGPEDSVGIATITATVSADENVHVSKDVVFTSTAPVDMLLSASPQSMPSRDVKENSVSRLRAKVMDESGNPVEGETVTFEIIPGSIVVGDYATTGNPYLEIEGQMNGVTAETNEDGYAIVEFHPGAFMTKQENPDWDVTDATATGTATVRATWVNDAGDRSATQDITLTWKNYPYLSVETAVSPETVAVDEAVDVTIRLRGDGWALQPDPIDVVLVIDRSGSMLRDKPDRMHSVREAAKVFVDNFAENYDRAGIVSFGKKGKITVAGEGSGLKGQIDNFYKCPKTYDDFATLDSSLTYNRQNIKEELDGIVPDHGTPMRGAIYKAINELSTNGRSDAVKTIVLLSDGDYNWYGDPLARGTGYLPSEYTPDKYGDLTSNYYEFSGLSDAEQNLAIYAQHKNIKIYSIGYANSITFGGVTTLKTLAESTGGKYYKGSAANIGAVYTAIAGELKTEAGVDTELDVVFRNVKVNGAPVGSEVDVFDYVYEDEVSTTIKSWIDDDDVGHYVIVPHTIDQTEDWETDHNLSFNIGTIRLDQTWETTFRLKVLEEGNIDVFGPGSTITFNNGADTLELPDTFITAVPDLNNMGITSCSLKVELGDPVPPNEQGAFYDTIPLTWTITYNGTRDIDEALAYSDDNGHSWTVFWTKTIDRSAEPGETLTGETLMDVSSLPADDYLIRLVASALDAPDAVDTTSAAIPIGNASRDYIKIG